MLSPVAIGSLAEAVLMLFEHRMLSRKSLRKPQYDEVTTS